jgi:hypothetical protein
MTAFDALSWRPIPRKAVILIGDAPAKDPEPVTGFTQSAVLDAARALDPATIYPVAVGDGPLDSFGPLASGSGGQLFSASDPSQVGDKVAAAVEQAAAPIYTSLTATTPARPGAQVAFSAAGSYYDPGAITAYDWDFDSDGIVDATTSASRTTHVYEAPFRGVASVTARTDDGHSATATAAVDVRADAPIAPDAPAGLAVTGTPDSLDASWQAPPSLGGGRLAGYDVILDDAETGEPVRAAATDRNSVEFAGLDRRRYLLRVRAVAEGGAGPAAELPIDLRGGEARPAAGSWVAQPSQPEPEQAPAARRPAGLRIVRARIRRGRLTALARIARDARGTVRVAYLAAGRTIAFRAAIRGGAIRVHHRLPRRMSRRRGRLTVSYAGDRSLLPAASALGCRPAPPAPATRAPSRSSA